MATSLARNFFFPGGFIEPNAYFSLNRALFEERLFVFVKPKQSMNYTRKYVFCQ